MGAGGSGASAAGDLSRDAHEAGDLSSFLDSSRFSTAFALSSDSSHYPHYPGLLLGENYTMLPAGASTKSLLMM